MYPHAPSAWHEVIAVAPSKPGSEPPNSRGQMFGGEVGGVFLIRLATETQPGYVNSELIKIKNTHLNKQGKFMKIQSLP